MAAFASATAVVPRLKNAVSWPTALLTAAGAVPTAFAGAALIAALPPQVVLVIFAARRTPQDGWTTATPRFGT